MKEALPQNHFIYTGVWNLRTKRFPKKKSILIVALLFVLLAAGIAGTYLFDEETSYSNQLRVAVFDLKVDEKDEPGPLISINGITPGESYVTTIPLKLIGHTSGKVSITFKNLKFEEETPTEPELKDLEKSSSPLWEHFYVSINGGSRTTLKEGLKRTIGTLKPNETTLVVITFEAKTSIDNEFQGDAVYFDAVFRAEQL